MGFSKQLLMMGIRDQSQLAATKLLTCQCLLTDRNCEHVRGRGGCCTVVEGRRTERWVSDGRSSVSDMSDVIDRSGSRRKSD